MNFLHEWAQYYPQLLAGLWVSIKLTVVTLVIGLPAGFLLALGTDISSRAGRIVTVCIVEIGRGAPALVILQLMYFGLPSVGLTLASFTAATLGLALTTAAYTSEIIRGGLQSVPTGEVEAASALGMTYRDTIRFIVLPRGLKIAIPPLVGFAIMIFQATSLAYTITMPELMSQAYSIGSSTFRYLSILAFAGLLYAAITIPASWATRRAEQRLGSTDYAI